MKMRAIILSIMLAAAAAAAPCENCSGGRVVGTGPVRFACPVCDGTGELPDAPAAPRPRPAVCRIECGAGPSRDCGSGVLVQVREGRAVVLTAWHVVRGNRDSIVIRWADGTIGPARVLASDEAYDLAALSADMAKAAPASVAAKPPAIGERLTIAGYGPAPFSYREQTGTVSQFVAPTGRHKANMVEVRASARQGDSGGPIFNEAGEVVAILWGSSNRITVGSHVAEIRSLLATPCLSVACRDGKCQLK